MSIHVNVCRPRANSAPCPSAGPFPQPALAKEGVRPDVVPHNQTSPGQPQLRPAQCVLPPSVASCQSPSSTEQAVSHHHRHIIPRQSVQQCTLISEQQTPDFAEQFFAPERGLPLPPQPSLIVGKQPALPNLKAEQQQTPADSFCNQQPSVQPSNLATLSAVFAPSLPATSAKAAGRGETHLVRTSGNFEEADGSIVSGGFARKIAACAAYAPAVFLGSGPRTLVLQASGFKQRATNITRAAALGTPAFAAGHLSSLVATPRPLCEGQAAAALKVAHLFPHNALSLLAVLFQWFLHSVGQERSCDGRVHPSKRKSFGKLLSISLVMGVVLCSLAASLITSPGLGLGTSHQIAKDQHLYATDKQGVSIGTRVFSLSNQVADNQKDRWPQQEQQPLEAFNAFARFVFACLVFCQQSCAFMMTQYGPLVFCCAARVVQSVHLQTTHTASGLSRVAVCASMAGGVTAVVGTLVR